MPEGQTKGSYAKGGKSPQAWSNLMDDHGGKAYAKSEWATKTNERSISKQMPLLSEFPGYSEWGNEAKRWTRMLHNRPISLSKDCFIINLNDVGALTGKEACGVAKRKLRSQVGENEEALKNGGCNEPID